MLDNQEYGTTKCCVGIITPLPHHLIPCQTKSDNDEITSRSIDLTPCDLEARIESSFTEDVAKTET